MNDENRISFEQFRTMCTSVTFAIDDDELIRGAGEKIAQWKAVGTPSFTEVQELFHESICAGASHMARDKIVEAIMASFGTELGGKRAMVSTWAKIAL